MVKNYRRMMEQVTLSDRKKEEIMDMLENKETQKRRMPRARALILAAALAVGCVLSIAAGLPAQVYNFMTGGTLSVMPAGGGIIGGAELVMNDGNENAPIVLEDGKLWFVNGEERTDITGLIDENTPYIYEHTDPATENKGYVIVGGTPENFGWAELTEMGTTGRVSAISGNNFAEVGGISLDDVMTDIHSGTFTYTEDDVESDGIQVIGSVANRPWLDTALNQLGLED